MDAIKKKMQAMKLEKDNAMDKADACEAQAKEANMRADKVNEEVGELQKKLAQVEGDLEANKQNLEQANKDLEEKEKALTNVSMFFLSMPPDTPLKNFIRPLSKTFQFILDQIQMNFSLENFIYIYTGGSFKIDESPAVLRSYEWGLVTRRIIRFLLCFSRFFSEKTRGVTGMF